MVRITATVLNVGNKVRGINYRVTSVQVALEYTETLRYPGENLHRGSLIRFRVPNRSNARSAFYSYKLDPNLGLPSPHRDALNSDLLISAMMGTHPEKQPRRKDGTLLPASRPCLGDNG